ncbi:MAG: hypothetical protein K6E37_03305 [Bacteroidales bacterium]|nr:hypothetical protein [Bacteroidales bacterium]
MKTRLFIVLAAAALLASCQKEVAVETVQQPEIKKTVLTVGIAPETKTTMDKTNTAEGHKVYWSPKDQIAVNGIASVALADDFEPAQSAQFTVESASLTIPYNVVYPASITTESDYSHVTLPAVQTYKADGFADNMFPMAGYSADGSGLELSHLCALLKISVTQETAAHAEARSGSVDTDNILSVRFHGRGNEKVSGVFAITYNSNPPALTPEDGIGSDVEVRVVKNQATSATAIDYYLVVPARTYEHGFDIMVQDINGDTMTMSKSSEWIAAPGKLYNMPSFQFAPTDTEVDVEIASAEDLISFAQSYNSKGYESLGGSLIVKVTGDIIFDGTTSVLFNETGGIGLKKSYYGDAEDYYFDGIIYGNNHTISGLNATVPLFKATNSASQIKDITIDNTCSFTFTHSKVAELDAGAVVGYHRGTLDNVTVNANVSLAAVSSVNKVTALGGIVGREVVGIVNNCKYGGAISVPSGFQASDQKVYIGGLVGEITNASGQVKDSWFLGTIDNQGQMIASSETDDIKANPQLMIGGIIGFNTGTIDNCTVANHATGITVTISENNLTGTVVTHSTNAYHYALAGIAGRNDGTVNECTNNATILNIFSGERGTSGNLNGRYLAMGGIVGYNTSGKTVSGSTNNGQIIDRAVPKVQYVGGVVGRNFGTVASCDNSSTGTVTVGSAYCDSPDAARLPYVGGILGCNESSGTISNVHNAANVVVDKTENVGGTIVVIGGIAGQSNAAIDGAKNGGTITNTGNISYTTANAKCSTPSGSNDYGFYLGGIVGYAMKAVKNVSNGGTVTNICNAAGVGMQYVYLGGVVGKLNASSSVDLEKCSNSANITFDPTSTAPHASSSGAYYNYCYLGGIVGYANNVNIKGDITTKCTNSGNVYGGDGSGNYNSGTPQNSFWVGGIVGYVKGASSISYCELTESGQSNNNHWSNRGTSWGSDGTMGASAYTSPGPAGGGIAGQVVGTADVKISISNCAVASTATIWGRRGARGGIVGISQYATISGCTVPVRINGGYWNGGIVGLANQTAISSCNYTGSRVDGTNESGGIVGFLDTESSVTSCNSSATTLSASTYKGGIAGASVAGTTIKKCHYKSSVNICGDSNFTAGTGDDANAADL